MTMVNEKRDIFKILEDKDTVFELYTSKALYLVELMRLKTRKTISNDTMLSKPLNKHKIVYMVGGTADEVTYTNNDAITWADALNRVLMVYLQSDLLDALDLQFLTGQQPTGGEEVLHLYKDSVQSVVQDVISKISTLRYIDIPKNERDEALAQYVMLEEKFKAELSGIL